MNPGGAAHWAIASPHELSTQAGVAAFRRGGNALDAALCTAASLTVTLPDNCALGGDLIALVREPSGAVSAVNASGMAPAGICADELRRRHGRAMPCFGPDTITVPGLLAGWEAIWLMGARLAWADVLAPAVEQARDGVPVARSVARALARDRSRLMADPGMRRIFSSAGRPLRQGERLTQPALARTLEAIADDGAQAFYGGDIGRSWLETVGARGSALNADDLSGYAAQLAKPLRAQRSGQEVLTAPPNSQGALLLMALGLLEQADASLDPLGREAPQLAEAFEATADVRTRHLADPRFRDVPVREIVAAKLPGPGARSVAANEGRGDTIAVVTTDSEGRAVSLIQSVFESFGAGILDEGTGILAHNRGACFSLDPASPNVLEPGKRPAHTLTPALVCRHGELRAVLGAMGGLAQPQILTHVLLHLRRGMVGVEALRAPRWTLAHNAWAGARRQITAEGRVPRPAVAALTGAGWSVSRLSDFDDHVGVAQLITCDEDGSFAAASDPRTEGAASAG